MKKKFVTLILVFTFIFASNVISSSSQQNFFNSDNFYKTVKELSASKYRGRLAGDKGNYLAEKYLSMRFRDLNLIPLGKNKTYFQPFEVYVPMVSGKCEFKVYDKTGKIVKEYTYDKDFKEVTWGASSSGIVKGKLRMDDEGIGNIYVYNKETYGENDKAYKEDKYLRKKGASAIIYPTNTTFNFRTPYKEQLGYSNGVVKIKVILDVIPELINYSKKGCTFEVKSTLSTKKVIANNVVGMIAGKNKNLPPIIISAHFDHVGCDANGRVYPGSLDNASGTAMMLEIANVIKKYSHMQRSVIFAAFNAEEEGLIGSNYFATHPPVNIKKAECINFDMVGSPNSIPITILASPKHFGFSKEIRKLADVSNIKTTPLYEDNSDHASFSSLGIDAITIIHNDILKIHSTDDTISNVDKDNLSQVFKLVDSYLKSRNITSVQALATTAEINKNDIADYYIIYAISIIFVVAFLFLGYRMSLRD